MLPNQSTYKGQKFFIKILILNNLCLEFNIVDIFFLFRSLKILEIKREKCQARGKNLFYYEYHAHKISKDFLSFYLAIV